MPFSVVHEFFFLKVRVNFLVFYTVQQEKWNFFQCHCQFFFTYLAGGRRLLRGCLTSRTFLTCEKMKIHSKLTMPSYNPNILVKYRMINCTLNRACMCSNDKSKIWMVQIILQSSKVGTRYLHALCALLLKVWQIKKLV